MIKWIPGAGDGPGGRLREKGAIDLPNRPVLSSEPGWIPCSRKQSVGPEVPQLIPTFHVFSLKA